ncbi:hypothetical protein [Crassaminicella thermophila]|uniref:hypothetical protein n=1 Tax=Crassaminicella thermophila TaxID=2599308 RepID=UPI00143CF4DE|nr:hypothetical protein [Crassaminicella thermophila]
MTQKTRKGIVGKKIPTTNSRENVGVGISFTSEHVSDSESIENIVEKKKIKQGLR